ncbi:MAG: F0F1 ATP synthase subunit alpha [Chloroflexi bacterium]|nr:F0F1 ATP synthase subunit alpha [Chloroflexota bacterium]
MSIKSEDIASALRQQIEAFDRPSEAVDVGTVVEAGDGIARIFGLSGVMSSEILEFSNGVFGLALNLEEDTVGAVIMGPYEEIKEGDEVRGTGRVMSVPIGPELAGRVVNSLGQPVDGKGPINTTETSVIEKVAPGVVTRKSVNVPLQTGIKAIDSMIPIGRGQRELIIGDRQTGKTAIALDTIINQKGKDVVCIYVAIGQKESDIANVMTILDRNGAMDHTIIVAAGASDPAALLYLSPFAGCTMGEYFRDRGQDALVIYDDLSKHAWAYRQVSLLLRRPPGREAYPGDVFYLHSRLLERASCLNEDHGGGTLTALPIIETQAGDVSAYIPTNVISITDGQIYLEPDLFYAGQRPAVNAGISVSRVGGDAQIKAMKQVAGRLRLDMAQYRELAAFAQIGSDLDRVTRQQLERGQRAMEILKQPQYVPLSVENQVISIFALNAGELDDVAVNDIDRFVTELLQHISASHREVADEIRESQALPEEVEEKLTAAISQFKQDVFQPSVQSGAA